MDFDELSEHLNALERDDCYRVDAVMKEGPYERTEKVFFVGANGSEQGPYVRKRIAADSGLGSAYECIFQTQKNGRRFTYLPRVVECYSTGADRVVVMEYVQGETLQDVVYRCDPSVALAVDLFPKICKAVDELHTSFDPPLIHRDLKPSNVMVSRDSLTIIDFGIARAYRNGADSDTKHFGTRAYAPPEQFGFGQTDVRSDVYALGMLLYFCLTEKTPDAKARAAAFASPAVPEAFRAIIQKAVELDPADRFQTVAELLAAFNDAVIGSSVFIAPGYPQGSAAKPAGAIKSMPFSGTCGSAASNASRRSMSAAEAFAPPPSAGLQSPTFAGNADSRPLRSGSGFLSRIPIGLGIAWDIVLLFVLGMFIAVSIRLMVSPDPASANAAYPLARRIIMYGSLDLFFFVPMAYLISDRRPLKRFIPVFRKLSVPKDILIFVIGFVVMFFIIGICTVLP